MKPIWPDAPRYAPELEFPPYRFVAGVHPHPTRDPAGHSRGKEDAAVHVAAERWQEDRAYLEGIDLFHAGFLWEAHEKWEGIWKASPDATQREFLQGLIQLAASMIKSQAGNAKGARGLLERAEARLARAGDRYMGLDVRTLLAGIAEPRLELTGSASG